MGHDLSFRDVSHPLWDWLIRAAKQERAHVVRIEAAGWKLEPAADFLPPLSPGPPAKELHWLLEHLKATDLHELVPRVRSQPDAVALKAGLFQIHSFLDASHELSQSIEGEGRHRSGDYWHAVNHRREPDYGNSKYWFRQVGRHPVFEPLAECAVDLLAGTPRIANEWQGRLVTSRGWDPFAFVDMCQSATGSADGELQQVARQIQLAEMRLLLDQTYDDAAGA
jgi:hypothetical protein